MSQRTDHPSMGSELALNAVKGQALNARLRDKSAALVMFFVRLLLLLALASGFVASVVPASVGAETVTITKNEILTALNKPDDWLLALVEVPPAPDFGEALAVSEARPSYGAPAGCVVKYVQRPFTREPDFGATSVNYDWRELWARGEIVT